MTAAALSSHPVSAVVASVRAELGSVTGTPAWSMPPEEVGATLVEVTRLAADTDVFHGTWSSTDLDGSHQKLSIRGSGPGIHAMRLYDDSASVACDGFPAHVQGTGSVEGNSLVMTGTLTCQPGGNWLADRISLSFTYSPGTDTLTDESGVTWVRS